MDVIDEPQSRRREDVPERIIIETLETWREHRDEWGPSEASRRFKRAKSTLIGWRDRYSDATLTKVPVPIKPGNRIRAKGAGKKRKVLAYEESVVEYYEACLRQDGVATHADILSYCRTKPEFLLKSEGAQKVWVSRFISRCKELFVSPSVRSLETIPASKNDNQSRGDIPSLAQIGNGQDAGGDEVNTQGASEEKANGEEACEGEASEQEASEQEASEQEASEEEASEEEASEEEASEEEKKKPGEDELDHEVENQSSRLPKTRYALRDRGDSAKAVFSYPNEENSSCPAKITVGVLAEDLASLDSYQNLSAIVIDFVIYKRLARGKEYVYPFGCSLFAQIEHVDRSTKSFSAVKGLVDKFDWASYPFVLIPISGLDHWSLLVMEHPLSEKVNCYHVDSIGGKHQSEYVFHVAKLFLGEIADRAFLVAGWAITMEPQQRNNYDCAIYMLYCMNRIACYIIDESPQTLMDEIKKLASMCTSAKADKFRYSLRAELRKLC